MENPGYVERARGLENPGYVGRAPLRVAPESAGKRPAYLKCNDWASLLLGRSADGDYCGMGDVAGRTIRGRPPL